jgi:Sulfotransferase domain
MSSPPPIANLILAGVGKAGTTSLFRYLEQHPAVCASSTKETRYFLPTSEVDEDVAGPLPPVAAYARFFCHCQSEAYRMEATPHYFFGGGSLIAAIQGAIAKPRIVLTLRDPTDRAISIFRFAKSMRLISADEPFDEFVRRGIDIATANEAQVFATRPYWSAVRGGLYSSFLSDWLAAFDDSELLVIFFEDLTASPIRTTQLVSHWLNIDADVCGTFRYTHENRTIPYRWSGLHRLALRVNGERGLRNRTRLKAPLRRLYSAVNRSDDPVWGAPPELVRHLRAFFQDDARRTAALLHARGYGGLPAWLGSPDLIRDPQHTSTQGAE